MNNFSKVINLHFTNACNYKCRFCHSRFQKSSLTLEDWKKIIDNISNSSKVERFNLAGGEPLLSPYIQEIIDFIHSKKIDVSIITNASLLTENFINANKDKIKVIGISIDALSESENITIGRHDNKFNTLSLERLTSLCNQIHKNGIILKINTVVNAINCNSNFAPLLDAVKPSRWKILRMIQIEGVNDKDIDIQVSNSEFQRFVLRHLKFNPVVENTNDIVNAYIIVNPDGKLIDNSNGKYHLSESLVDHNFEDEFKKIAFNPDAYKKRYA